jgi:hypothetical protein
MKTTCNFCKTEFNLDGVPLGPVSCPLCGNVWTVAAPRRRNSFLVFFAALCALLAAAIFAFVVVMRHNANEKLANPLVASITDITTVTDESGVRHFVVSGTVTNRSDEIYGVPDLIISSRDDDERVIASQKFMPSATLLEPGRSAEFTHTLSAPTTGVKKLTAELKKE